MSIPNFILTTCKTPGCLRKRGCHGKHWRTYCGSTEFCTTHCKGGEGKHSHCCHDNCGRIHKEGFPTCDMHTRGLYWGQIVEPKNDACSRCGRSEAEWGSKLCEKCCTLFPRIHFKVRPSKKELARFRAPSDPRPVEMRRRNVRFRRGGF